MASADEYDKVELPAIEQLQRLGWTYIHGVELSPETSVERQYWRDVVLQKRLTSAIQKLNPWINEENLRKVVREIRFAGTENPTLIETNQQIWDKLVNYISVEQDLGQGRKGQTVKIIDFDNPEENEYICSNQYKVEGINQNIIPDIVLFVNGLPLAVIECKSPYITNPMEAGIDQLLRYANTRAPHEDEGAERLFWFNQVVVSTHRDKARVGTISSRMEHYLEWKDPYPFSVEQIVDEQLIAPTISDASNDAEYAQAQKVAQQSGSFSSPNSQQILIAGLFDKKNFLDVIQNFTIFEPTDGKVIKKIPRYQQYRAVHKTIERLKTGKTKKDKGGVIWHTQGSGKSLTMVFLAIKLRRDPELQKYKLVFLTDRTQLDEQLTETFRKTQDETIHNAKSVADLKDLLSRDSSDLVTAMVQKFQEGIDDVDFKELNPSDKVIVLADEGHRTQYGALGAAINIALPNAPKIAFTGTPLIKSQKTNNEFGTYIDTYTIEQAVDDGATVRIVYEGRQAETKVTGDSLDKLFDEYFGDRPEDEQNAIKKKYGTELAVLEAPQRIRWICLDILKHYREKIEPNGFKGMIVTPSRRAAVLYKEQLDELGAPPSEVIISGDHNDSEFFSKYTDGSKQKQHITNFKKPKKAKNPEDAHPLSILVVKDMLLTGFDAPICQVLYLDRKLREHTLLQAIARVNRTYQEKQRGYIVDYYGLSDYLTEALDMFSSEDVQGALQDLKEEIPRLEHAHTRVISHFKGMDLNDIDACVLSLEDEEKRQQFDIDFKRFAKQMDIILPDKAAAPYLSDLKQLGKINQGARNLYRDTQLSLTGVGEKVRQLIDEHLYAVGINSKIPPIDLLASNYKEQLNNHKSDRAKASEIEHAIRSHINVNLEQDEEYYKSLAEKLEKIIEKRSEHWNELVQLLLEFRDNIESERTKQAEDLGLDETEFAFHNILMVEISRVTGDEIIPEETHQEVLEVTKDLVELFEEATKIVGFFSKHDEVKEVRKRIKRRILETSFDEEELRSVVMDRFMDLAKVKFGKKQ